MGERSEKMSLNWKKFLKEELKEKIGDYKKSVEE